MEHVRRTLEGQGSHDFSHIERVLHNAALISEDSIVDYNVLLASVLLHDIVFETADTHHIDSANAAKELLPNYGFTDTQAVWHAIVNHNRSFQPYDHLEKMSAEAKVLYDADTLDALGAVGLVRMITFSPKEGVPYLVSEQDSVDESVYENIKFLEQMQENLILDVSRNIAEERMPLVYDFLEQMRRECSNV